MLTHMKFKNRPVHLFNIAGRKYYVARSSAPQTGTVALSSANGAAAVLAPANMSYRQAAMKAAQWMTQRKEPRPGASEEFEVLPL